MHDEYWQKVKKEAEMQLASLFGDNWAETIRDADADLFFTGLQ